MNEEQLKKVLKERNRVRSLLNDQTFKNADEAKSMDTLGNIAKLLKDLNK